SLRISRPPSYTLFPYTTLFRSPDLQETDLNDFGGWVFDFYCSKGLWSADPNSDLKITGLKSYEYPILSDLLEYLQKINTKTFTRDRKSTRLNSSHVSISYAVFC